MEKEDKQVFFEEIIDQNSDPDFYVKVFINDVEFVSDVWDNTLYIYDPQWSAVLDVPDDEEFVDIKIQLWDSMDENYDGNRLCDVSGDYDGTDDSYDVELVYSVKTGHWTGDDYLSVDSSVFDQVLYVISLLWALMAELLQNAKSNLRDLNSRCDER